MENSVRPMRAGDLDRAAAVLADAFTGYPWTDWCVAADAHTERLAGLQRIYLEHLALPYGAADIDATGSGVAAFVPPDVPEPDESVVSRIVELHGDRVGRLAEAEDQLSRLPADPDAWTLATVGVARAGQGAGLGGALLATGLEELDRHSRACSLDTSTDRNLALYERHGFVVTGHVALDGGPQVWRMHRRAAHRA
ncbi:GNAT family N-acetyltransferase [Rhodococcus kronopolitis]|uniref:GNAT family N-acetyltransferase n=1 Tax=Rhodococcus kronopolitis TaxID=1460226 RepID=A0ABV9FPV9_9NOCA